MTVTSQDGRHVIPQSEETYSKEQLQLMKTQDLKYVQMKLAIEEKVSGGLQWRPALVVRGGLHWW